MVRLLVEKKCRVAQHAHVLNAAQDALLIDLGQPALSFPLPHERGQDVALLVIRLSLLWLVNGTRKIWSVRSGSSFSTSGRVRRSRIGANCP